MKVGAVQFFPVFGAVARNIAKAISMVRDSDADLWVLPEHFATGYQFKDREEVMALAEPADGPTVTTMAGKAAELGCYFCGGFPEREGDLLFNSAFLVGPEGVVGIYRKIHLFDREKELYAPGSGGFRTFDVGGTKVGVMICFDWYFPESARTLGLRGAQVIAHPSNLVLPHCPEAMKFRALENRVFTVTANRIGTESRLPDEELAYIGQSVIYSPMGELLARGDEVAEEVLLVEIDETQALDKAVTSRNDVHGDRRPAFYKLK